MYFAIPNLSSDFVTTVVPWEYKSSLPAFPDKGTAYPFWQNNTTRHAFITRYEGTFKAQRNNPTNNPPCLMHGLIVDYDGNVTQAALDAVGSKTPYEIRPTHYCRTVSNKARLMWDFEAPVRVPENPALMKAFLLKIAKYMKLNRWLAGFDSDAFSNPCQYYEIGTGWTRVSEEKLKTSTLWQWMYEAGQDIVWEDKTCRIPISDIAAEVESRWPGRWKAPFDLGYRSVRFWDPQADNETAAVIRESGMQCFTGPKTFVPWIEILGKPFVDKYRATQLDVIASGIFFDGHDYWYKTGDSHWNDWSVEHLKLRLKVAHKLRATSTRKDADGASEIEHALQFIHTNNRIEAAFPFVHRPEGPIMHDRKRYLNITAYKALQPAESASKEWGDGFPWVGKFIKDMLGDKALPYFLTWLRHFYVNGYHQTPQDGHALFLVGDAGVGKSMLASFILAELLGGYSDASSFFLGEDRFTDYVLSKPIMLIDDTAPSSDHVRHTRYSAMIKKVVANKQLKYEKKFQKAAMVPWQGRVIVCCNADPESVRLIPNLDLSIVDKLMLFYCHEPKEGFPESRVIAETVHRELPFLARWLMEFNPPPECLGSTRFYAKSYLDPRLVQTANHSSTVNAFLEVLSIFLTEQKLVFPDQANWSGTASDLYRAMVADEGIKMLVSKWSAQSMSTYLGQLKSRGYPLEKDRTKSLRSWLIPFHLATYVPASGGYIEPQE